MAGVIDIDDLADEIMAGLMEYSDLAAETVKGAVKKAGNKVKKEIQSNGYQPVYEHRTVCFSIFLYRLFDGIRYRWLRNRRI